MKFIESLFEGSLWSSRFIVLAAVLGSLFAGFAIFYMATVDVVYLVQHMLHYADSDMTEEARKILHDRTVSHIVEVVDGYLLATVMLIFSFGLYELFISDIDQAHEGEGSSKILVINSLDDLKARLAKVILMIMIVTLFEEALNMKMDAPIDLIYLGGAIAMVALALYLTHSAEHGAKDGHEEESADEADSGKEPAHRGEQH
ncbi:MAG: YqhA family protein [Nitrosomonadales bacterium]|nr:YqhA family protein [Nitrosomonadales bacterium]